MRKPFKDRREAGQLLAGALAAYMDRPDVVVLGLPRGGVPVAFEVAERLNAPLDVIVVRKLGVPGQRELALGAITMGGVRVLNEDVVRRLGITPRQVETAAARESEELKRRERLYRGDCPPLDVRGRTVILVDDGLATGVTMLAALALLRRQHPAHIVVAVPVASLATYLEFVGGGEDIVCLETPEWFFAVGEWYEDYSQTTDEEVKDLLGRAARAASGL